MRKPYRISIAVKRLVVLGACYGLLSGCSGYRDLEIENHFPFPVRLQYTYGTNDHKTAVCKVGWVSQDETVLFKGGAGVEGSGLSSMEILRGNGKVLGSLETYTLSEQKIERFGCNGTTTHYISIGERTPAAVTLARLTDVPLSVRKTPLVRVPRYCSPLRKT